MKIDKKITVAKFIESMPIDRQTDICRLIDKQIDIQKDRYTNRQIYRKIDIQTDRYTDDRFTDKQIYIQMDIQNDKWTYR